MTQPTANWIVRPAAMADLPTLVEFNRCLAEESEGRRLNPQVLARGVERVLLDASLGQYFVAEQPATDAAAAVIGQTLITYEWSDWRAGMFWWIQSVYVRADHRGRGVFRALYAHLTSRARQTPDVCGLRLYVENHNRAALATYQRLGMRPSGHQLYEHDWSGVAGIIAAEQ